MTIVIHNQMGIRAVLLACIASLTLLVLLVLLPHAATAQATPGVTVAVDPFTSCATDAPITGTATIVGLAPDSGFAFTVQLRGDGDVLDRQVRRDPDRLADGRLAWSVAAAPGAPHELFELSFTLHDAEQRPIHNELMVLNPECDAVQSGPASPPASPGSTTPPGARPGSTPSLAADLDGERDAVLVAGFAGATVLVLAALAFLDRRPEP